MFQPLPKNRPSGKIPSTDVTNELADALRNLGQTDSGAIGSDERHAVTVVELSTPVSGQVGRFNAKRFNLYSKPNATGGLVKADVGQTETTDTCIVYDGDDVANLRVCIPLGRTAVSGSTGGKLVLLALPRGTFPVQVSVDGGSDGTQTTQATWTYTVKDLSGNTMGTAVGQTRPRPKGKAAAQANGYGLAFYDGSTLILWDAGEYYPTGDCP